MYDEYFGLKSDPFRLTPTGISVFDHPAYRKSRAYLEYALHRKEGFVLLCGPPGSGKTSLIMAIEQSLAESEIEMIVLSCHNVNANDLMRLYATALGVDLNKYDGGTVIVGIVEELNRLRSIGKHAVLVLDEAQGLSVDALEQARLLTNHNAQKTPLLQIMLVGQLDLRVKMQSPELTQLHQRIISSTSLNVLDLEETRDYFLHRLNAVGWNENPSFDEDIYQFLHTASAGIPRCINQIGSRLLLNAYVEKVHTIGVENIQQVIADLSHEQLLPVGAGMAESVDRT